MQSRGGDGSARGVVCQTRPMAGWLCDECGHYLFLEAQACPRCGSDVGFHWPSLTFAKHARDRGGTFLVICLISFVIFHVIINVAMQIGVLPTTGIPLPLISYGGSSTLMFFIAVGLMANVDMRRFVNA